MKTKFFNNPLLYKILFVLSLAILLFISSIAYKHIKNVSASSNLVVHTYKVNLKLEQLISYLKDAESGLQSYVITKDSMFLKPYFTSHEKVNDAFISLKKLTSDNNKQQQNLTVLFNLIKKSFTNFDKTILSNSLSNESGRKEFETNFLEGQQIMSSNRKQINKMIPSQKE